MEKAANNSIGMNNGIHNDLIEDGVYSRLPEVLSEITKTFNGRERDIVLTSALGVLSCCLPNLYGIYDGDKVFPHLYAIIIAPAASGKGVMGKSRILIDEIHNRILKDSIDAQEKCEEKKKKSEEKEFGKCPAVAIKIMPANISTSEMYSFLGTSQHGLIIIETEADTMSQM